MSKNHSSERGGATLKFLIVMAVIGCFVYAGWLYIPVAYQAYQYKDLMQHYVDMAAAQGKPVSWACDQLAKSEAEYEIPSNAVITPGALNERMEIRVQYTRPIEFPGFTYEYEFDHTCQECGRSLHSNRHSVD
jgi:hypothetical protein